MEKLKFNKECIVLEVNDNKECITLNFGDQSFAPKFFALVDGFESKYKEFTKKAEEIDKSSDEKNEYGMSERLRRGLALNLEFHQYFSKEIDGVFGENTCKKVFGDIVPSIELISRFIEAVTPYFNDYSLKRNKIITKYSAERNGNV